jgi:hypothetical protein
MSFILEANRRGQLQVNAWTWRPTLELLLNENLIDRERYELLGANGCGAEVDRELASRFADAIERRLKWADMKEGHRMLADLTITSDERKPVAFSPAESADAVDVNDLYSATYEWLITFGEFCRGSGGFKVI